jgi:hypothetical protein
MAYKEPLTRMGLEYKNHGSILLGELGFGALHFVVVVLGVLDMYACI